MCCLDGFFQGSGLKVLDAILTNNIRRVKYPPNPDEINARAKQVGKEEKLHAGPRPPASSQPGGAAAQQMPWDNASEIRVRHKWVDAYRGEKLSLHEADPGPTTDTAMSARGPCQAEPGQALHCQEPREQCQAVPGSRHGMSM